MSSSVYYLCATAFDQTQTKRNTCTCIQQTFALTQKLSVETTFKFCRRLDSAPENFETVYRHYYLRRSTAKPFGQETVQQTIQLKLHF